MVAEPSKVSDVQVAVSPAAGSSVSSVGSTVKEEPNKDPEAPGRKKPRYRAGSKAKKSTVERRSEAKQEERVARGVTDRQASAQGHTKIKAIDLSKMDKEI